jgi:hypothetical protein
MSTQPRVKDQDQGAVLGTPAGGTAGGYNIAGTGAIGVGSSRVSYDKPDLVRTAAVTNAVYQNLMGRDATAKEIEKYHQEFLKYAASHPSSVSGTDASGSGTSTSTGLTETDYITNLVKGTAEAGDYTAATSYFDAMKSAMNTFSGGY